MILRSALTFAFASLVAFSCSAQQPPSSARLPHLERRGQATQLVVDGQPFLMLGGELHNSSSSSVDYMKPVWPRLAKMHLNTVLMPVAWETIEPAEGQFDFQCVDGLLQGARQNNLHLVVLWFGAWKNTYSSYAPGWIKRDGKRFPRVQMSSGRETERLSPFSDSVREADTRAFARLMHHLRQVDSDRHTVLMVQVENEVGVIPESRDHSAIAETYFSSPVPAELTRYLEMHRVALNPELRSLWEQSGARRTGTWQEVFGKTLLTDDLFMAWSFASYIEHVAAAGKAEYALPMYANAALIRPNYEPGQYNSGGPLPHSLDIWRAAAPSLNFFSPDIYFNDFTRWAGEYSQPGNPLFIPEAQGGPAGAANALYAFGQLSALGFSPFGIDDPSHTPIDLAGIASTPENGNEDSIGEEYAMLSNLAPLILEKQRSGTIEGALIESDAQRAGRLPIGDYTANIVQSNKSDGERSRIGILFIQTGPDEFLVAGRGDAQITFSSDKFAAAAVGIESIDEEFFDGGAWVPRRRLNGDENSQGQVLHLSNSDAAQGRIYKLRLYHYR